MCTESSVPFLYNTFHLHACPHCRMSFMAYGMWAPVLVWYILSVVILVG